MIGKESSIQRKKQKESFMKKHYYESIMLPILIGFSFNASLFSVSYSSLYSAHESSWLFLEDLIIKEPQRQVDALFGIGGGLVLASIGTTALTYKLARYLTSSTSKVGIVGAGATRLITGFIQHYAFRKHLLKQAERQQIITTMRMWHHIRDKTPYETWSCLDSLHNLWTKDKKSFNENLDTSLAYLKAEIYGRFPNKYGDNTSPFFSRRNLHVQITFDAYKALQSFFKTVKELLV